MCGERPAVLLLLIVRACPYPDLVGVWLGHVACTIPVAAGAWFLAEPDI